MLRFMGLQRVGHDGATELNWSAPKLTLFHLHSAFYNLRDAGNSVPASMVVLIHYVVLIPSFISDIGN